MTFADLVEQARLLPEEEKLELRQVLEHDLIETARMDLELSHREAVILWETHQLPEPTSDVDEFMRRLNAQ